MKKSKIKNQTPTSAPTETLDLSTKIESSETSETTETTSETDEPEVIPTELPTNKIMAKLSPEFGKFIEEKLQVSAKTGNIMSKTIEGMRSGLKSIPYTFTDIQTLFAMIDKGMVHNGENKVERFHHIAELLSVNPKFKDLTEEQKTTVTSLIIPSDTQIEKMKAHFGMTPEQMTDFLAGKVKIVETKTQVTGTYRRHLWENNNLFVEVNYFTTLPGTEKEVKAKLWRTLPFWKLAPAEAPAEV